MLSTGENERGLNEHTNLIAVILLICKELKSIRFQPGSGVKFKKGGVQFSEIGVFEQPNLNTKYHTYTRTHTLLRKRRALGLFVPMSLMLRAETEEVKELRATMKDILITSISRPCALPPFTAESFEFFENIWP